MPQAMGVMSLIEPPDGQGSRWRQLLTEGTLETRDGRWAERNRSMLVAWCGAGAPAIRPSGLHEALTTRFASCAPAGAPDTDGLRAVANHEPPQPGTRPKPAI
jgi:hypothetical protein